MSVTIVARAKRTVFGENRQFTVYQETIAGRVLRYVISCKKCRKQKLFPGNPRHIHHLCCKRTLSFEPSLGHLPEPEHTEPVVPEPSSKDGAPAKKDAAAAKARDRTSSKKASSSKGPPATGKKASPGKKAAAARKPVPKKASAAKKRAAKKAPAKKS